MWVSANRYARELADARADVAAAKADAKYQETKAVIAAHELAMLRAECEQSILKWVGRRVVVNQQAGDDNVRGTLTHVYDDHIVLAHVEAFERRRDGNTGELALRPVPIPGEFVIPRDNVANLQVLAPEE